MTVQQMKASIDRAELETIRRRMRRKGTKRIIKTSAKWTGGILLFAGSLLGIGAATAASRKGSR